MLHPYSVVPRAQLCRPTCARDPKSAASRGSKHFPFPGLRSSHNFTCLCPTPPKLALARFGQSQSNLLPILLQPPPFLQQNQVPIAKLSCSSNVISPSAAMPSFFENHCATKLRRRSSKSACDERSQLQHFLQQAQRCRTCSLVQMQMSGQGSKFTLSL